MMRALSNEGDIRRAAAQLRAEIESHSYRELKVTWGFPNGDRQTLDSCILRGIRNDIYVGFGVLRPNVVSHIFKLVDHGSDPTDAFYPNAEVNVSLLGKRGVAGMLAADGSDTWLCHSAMFNAFRTKIAREKSLTFFRDFVVSVVDGERQREVIPVVALGSSTFVADIEAFVLRVLDLKDQFKTGGELTEKAKRDEDKAAEAPKNEDPWRWNDGDEFEGMKTAGNRDGVTYEYRHGPLCNRLKSALEDWIKLRTRREPLIARRTVNIDSAIVGHDMRARVIFEVKTSGSLGGELYKAIGQLLHYRRKRGTPDTHLVLTLPGEVDGTANDTIDFFNELGIYVIYETEPGIFKASDGTTLEARLDGLLG
ncbi:hypothetical protein [Bordetella genomosp. 9]|uniref:Uncharacterized protein n=1 Tax=Bordetella genomosp. 9 TaxID=1416803 RepID=A0A1W6YW18_9BORD|nr:hypothetical protein [Bordetella genomosp. 9]ARP85266.1 hypothetical protein CAL13_02825 [Bordetella genomosp. 9]